MRLPRFSVFALLVSIAAPAFTAVPHKQSPMRYKELWLDSPFTTKPTKETTPPPTPNPLEDYTLASLCKIEQGWHVILINKKDRTDRVRLKPEKQNKLGFRVVSVENPESRTGARVQIDAAGSLGWVEFEPKFLVVKGASPRTGANKGTQGKNGRLRNVPPIPGYKPKVSKIPVPRKK